MSNISVVFMGSGKFAVEVLKEILECDKIDLMGVITQRDKPVGRKKVITPTLVRQYSLSVNVDCFVAGSSEEVLKVFKEESLEFDFLVVADYGVILSNEVLNVADSCSLNVHGSILPKYRGASPVQAALINNDKVAGVSVITMTDELDAGPVWLVHEVEILESEKYDSLLLRLGNVGGLAVVKVITEFENFTPLYQDEAQATYAVKVNKSDGIVSLGEDSIEEVYGKFRAFNVWPGLFFTFNNLKFQVIECEVLKDSDFLSSEKLAVVKDENLYLRFNGGFLKVSELKPEGKNVMSVSDFLRGNAAFFD